jgi:Tfp pilus assembly protein PilO
VLVAAGGGVVVLLLWFFMLWSPRSSDLSDAQDRVQQAQDEADRLELRVRRLLTLQDQATELRSELEDLRAAVPDDPNLAAFILEADDAASQSGIDFVSITPNEPVAAEAPGGPAVVNLSISAIGGYFQTLDFLNRLADLDRLVVIDSLSISAAVQAGTVELNSSIAGRMFLAELPVTSGVPGGAGGDAGSSATTTTIPESTTTTAAT